MKFVLQVGGTVLFLVVLVAVQFGYFFRPITLADVIQVRDIFFCLIDQYPVGSASTYIGIYTLSIIFGVPISTTILGGYFFGLVKGVIYSTISIALGSFILCAFIRYILTGWARRRYKESLQPFTRELKKYGVYYIAMIHAIPFIPSFLPHIAAGMSSISLGGIVLFNILGAFPLTVVYVAAGFYFQQVTSLEAFVYYVSIFGSMLASLLGAYIFYRRHLNT